MTPACYLCQIRASAIQLVDHDLCLQCAHEMIDQAAADHAAERARVEAARRTRVSAIDTVVNGVAGVLLNGRFVSGMRARHFRRTETALAI